MASGASGEVVHCPHCNEDVPKTLYCLNCGFPLYKEEQPKEEAKVEPENKIELKQVQPVEEDTLIVVDDEKEEIKPEEPKLEKPAAPEVKEEAPPIEVAHTPSEQESKELEEATEPAPMPEVSEKIEKPMPVIVPVEAPAPVVEAHISEPIEAVATVDPTPTQADDPTSAEVPSEPLSPRLGPLKIEAVEVIEEYQTPKAFIPDPLIKDLMENLSKNISLKIKLVKLYRDGVVKEETFTKLFERYASEGKIWYSRREEMLKKLAADMEEMEEANAIASEALELLEIRKSIGETSASEYNAKAPAYRWDVDNFDLMIDDKKNRIAYLENASSALTEAELKELRELASVQYNTLESLQLSKDELIAQIKDSLYEAIKTLG